MLLIVYASHKALNRMMSSNRTQRYRMTVELCESDVTKIPQWCHFSICRSCINHGDSPAFTQRSGHGAALTLNN